ncbi:MAG: hypothetical protein WDM70_11015 [Nitrosomonadales bacterium]
MNLGSDHTGNLGLRNGVDVVSIKSYPYRNITGQINSFMLRRNLANGDKEIRPRSCWKKNSGRPTIEKRAPSQPYTLYNLDQLASRPEAPVLVTEGEKSADAASKLFPDHVVTTTMFGAQSPLNSDLMPLVGRNVTFWPDNDNAGVGYVDKIADFLHKQDSSMKMHILTPPRFKAVKDAEGQSMLESMPEELPPGWMPLMLWLMGGLLTISCYCLQHSLPSMWCLNLIKIENLSRTGRIHIYTTIASAMDIFALANVIRKRVR